MYFNLTIVKINHMESAQWQFIYFLIILHYYSHRDWRKNVRNIVINYYNWLKIFFEQWIIYVLQSMEIFLGLMWVILFMASGGDIIKYFMDYFYWMVWWLATHTRPPLPFNESFTADCWWNLNTPEYIEINLKILRFHSI